MEAEDWSDWPQPPGDGSLEYGDLHRYANVRLPAEMFWQDDRAFGFAGTPFASSRRECWERAERMYEKHLLEES